MRYSLIALCACFVLEPALGSKDAKGAELTSELVERVLAGQEIHATVTFSRCTNAVTKTPGPNVIGSFQSHGVMVLSDQAMAFSTDSTVIHPDGSIVREISAYRIAPSGLVNVTTHFLDPGTLHSQRETEYLCRFGDSFVAH